MDAIRLFYEWGEPNRNLEISKEDFYRKIEYNTDGSKDDELIDDLKNIQELKTLSLNGLINYKTRWVPPKRRKQPERYANSSNYIACVAGIPK
jgi:hypothetical protein